MALPRHPHSWERFLGIRAFKHTEDVAMYPVLDPHNLRI